MPAKWSIRVTNSKMWKKMRRRKSFLLWYLSFELNSTNATCPEGRIFNNCTSSCEDKKVDITTETGDGTTKDDDDTRHDDPHELVYDIQSKETKRTLRKL